MNFISYEQLSKDILILINKLPRNKYDSIYGVSRSGVIPANIIAFHFNLPCGTTNEFINGVNINTSNRSSKLNMSLIKNILVVDDCIGSGKSIKKEMDRINPIAHQRQINVDYACVYSSNDNDKRVNFISKKLSHPRVFQWNIFHCGHMSTAVLDIDGVINHDPNFSEDSEEQFRKFINTAKPLYIPTYPVHSFITNRLEKYRSDTEAYLRRYKIQYQKLYMCQCKTPQERRKLNRNALQKAETFNKIVGAKWFIESSKAQAIIIKKHINQPVFCVETMSMI